jgi:hypothetical protein
MNTPEKEPATSAASKHTLGTPSLTPQEPKLADESSTRTKIRRIVPAVGLALIVFSFGVIVGWMTSSHYVKTHAPENIKVRFEDFPHGGMHRDKLMPDANDTSGAAIIEVSGVVTQVSADSFTIAGNGTTKTIKTTGSTTYNTGSGKAAVNDSVHVSATKNGDTLTAVSVRVANK